MTKGGNVSFFFSLFLGLPVLCLKDAKLSQEEGPPLSSLGDVDLYYVKHLFFIETSISMC